MNKILNRAMIMLKIGINYNQLLRLKVSCFQSSGTWSYFTANVVMQLTLPYLIILKLLVIIINFKIIRYGNVSCINIFSVE